MIRDLAARTAGLSALGARLFGPVADLIVRLFLSGVFLASQMHGLMMGLPAAPGGGLHGLMVSDLGQVVQAVCPALLAIGLAARPAAAAMLLQMLLMPPDPAAAAFTTLLLLRPALLGAGPFAVDRLLLRGAESLAVPGAGALARAAHAAAPVLHAATLAALRVGVAAALWAGPGTFGMHVPAALDLPPAALAIAAVLLVCGAGTRLVALLLVAVALWGGGADWSLLAAWTLLLALVAAHGAGAWSFDARLGAVLRRRVTPAAASLPHVIVVGGGFGGVAAVRGLRHAACRVTLIDRRNHHLFQPLLYQVATAGLSPADIATPIRALFRGQANVRVLLGEVTGVDAAARVVRLARGALAYDHLVLATGAQHGYFGRDDWASDAPGLKTLDDATAIRRRLLLAFEAAEDAEPGPARDAWLTFVIVGGGPTGVELAGAIAELARHGLEGEFRRIDPAAARVVLVQSGPRLLPAFPEALGRDAERALRHLGVEVALDRKVEAVDADGVVVSGTTMAARTVIWAAGVTASPAALWLGVASDRAGRVPVGADLSVPGCPGVLVVGDTAASKAWRGRDVPGLAPAAKQGGAYAARLIRAQLAGRPPPPPFRYRHAGSLATIGRQSAVADFGVLRVRGALAWWLWGAAHVAFLVGGRNRATVLLQWLWAYLTFRRGSRLITGPAA